MYSVPEFNTIEDALKYAYDKTIEQGEGSYYGMSLEAAYRGDHGRKCSIGWLISDKCYDPEVCCGNVDNIEILGLISESTGMSLDLLSGDKNLNYLYRLQSCHDDIHASSVVFSFITDFKDKVNKNVINKELPDIFEVTDV